MLTERAPAKPWRVKYDGACARCGTPLLRGTVAVWDRASRTIHCVECPGGSGDMPLRAFDTGMAGASASQEFERRMAKREAKAKAKWGERFGGYVTRFAEPPQSTRAWAIGARGEEKLAAELAKVDGLLVLNDRAVPKTRRNIDHIVVAPAGVFVIDAKNIRGRIHIPNRGWPWKPDYRLVVGSRDRSGLAEQLDWQVDVVGRALMSASLDPMPTITPVLCFIDGDWPLIAPPDEFQGVRLASERSIRRLLTRSDELDGQRIVEVARILSLALPPKAVA